jgi:hypothetical protein
MHTFVRKSERTEIMASDAKQNSANKAQSAEKPQPTHSDLPENELAQVSGGFNPQPEPPGDKALRPVSLPAEKLLLRGN